MATRAFMVMAHDDGRPTEVITPDGRIGLLFPRPSDDGEGIFYGRPEVSKAVFRIHPDGKEEFIIGGLSVEDVRKEIFSKNSYGYRPGCEDWELVERLTVTFY